MVHAAAPYDDDLNALIAAAQAGDQAACAAIYQRFVRPVYRLAYGVLLSEEDAEEVVQDSFAYALQNIGHFDATRSAFRTWLYTITLSRCRNKRRRKWLPTVALGDMLEWLPGNDPLPEAVAEQHSVRDTVHEALSKLSPKLREAIILRYFDGLSYREMAEVLGCPQKTAESRVRLAHEALYAILSAQPDMLPEGAYAHERV